METPMFQPLVAATISAAIAARSYRKKSLDLSGAVSGFFVMAIHIAVNYRLFFLVTSILEFHLCLCICFFPV